MSKWVFERISVMKRKFINGANWESYATCTSKIIHINDMFSGYISLIKVDKVKQKITVDYRQSDICLIDDGYKCLMFLPDSNNWCVSAVYNRVNEIIEWYFDMTKINSIDEYGNPFYDDLYLDIAVSPDFKVVILDEDELKEALESKEITETDYDMAHYTCDKIIKEVITKKEFLISFFNKYLVYLEH